MSGFEAVVFDLYGTLVPEFPLSDWDAMFERMAAELGVDPSAFRRAWDATMVERQTGRLGDIHANLREICRRIGARPDEEGVVRALELRTRMYRELFHPRAGAVQTIRWLRDRDTRTALISMCAPDTPALWHASPVEGLIDVLVFSSETGMRKPDPEIYLAACEALDVVPERCLYVGDGSYRELSGAAAVGMSAVLIRDPGEEAGSVLGPQAEPWDGTTISSLIELRSFFPLA